MVARLGVVGFGAMGSEIAFLGACAGIAVTAYDEFLQSLENNLARLAKVAKLLARDPKFFAAATLSEDTSREEVLGRISRAESLADFAGCDFVIEAAPEIIELKHKLFNGLAEAVSPDCVLASNTSSISITELAHGVPQPERVIGMHFFNPPTAMGLVEVIPGLATSEAAVAATVALAEAMHKKPIRVRETPGFVVNRVLLAMMNEAIRLAEEGVASLEDIDDAMRLGAGFPLGPFKLADLVGLDVLEHACDTVYRELGDDKFRPPMMLRQHVRAGRLGRKTRWGFYKY